MKLIIETFENTGNLHHAYILEGEKESIREKLLNFLEKKLKHPVQGNPDFHHAQYESFSIDDARNLKDLQATKAISFPRKIFLIEMLTMTVEAQNALLKVFEEPTEGTHFFIIMPNADMLLPTLRSRLIVVQNENNEEGNVGKNFAQKFLKATPAERLILVADILEEKDKAKTGELIDNLIIELRKKKHGILEHTKNSTKLLNELLTLRSYSTDRSPSLKLILEHISLIV
jgi:DNA polymerase III delta prime subunit